MDSVNILYTRGSTVKEIPEESLRQIIDVSPRIKLTYIGDLISEEQNGDASAKKKLDSLLAEAEIIYGSMVLLPILPTIPARAPKLKWMQVQHAGLEKFLIPKIVESPFMLTSSTGMHSIAISEFVIGRMLMFAKLAPYSFRLQQNKQWRTGFYPPTTLESKTLGIVGFGNIGQELARLAKALRMRVLATRRSAKLGEQAENVDSLLPASELPELLSESDYVALLLPFTPETAGLIGEKELRMMKSTAYLINVSRGGILDDEALIQALEENWIAGAAVDVFATEPLPADSKMWELPNLIFSPHMAGTMQEYGVKATEVFVKNLKRYMNGEQLLNVVDKKKGY